jgi:hypothetical protein
MTLWKKIAVPKTPHQILCFSWNIWCVFG